jgi:hypothetical protein
MKYAVLVALLATVDASYPQYMMQMQGTPDDSRKAW